MGRTLSHETSGTSSYGDTFTSRPQRSQKARSRSSMTPIVLQTIAMLGLGALFYPSAANWFASFGQTSQISTYVGEVGQLSEQARAQKLQVAQEYNAQLPSSTLQDPYAQGSRRDDHAEDAAYQAYLQVLRVSDNGVIGQITYDRLGISLPIYHGTSETAISRGVGHLYGSSLPIGGPSTHSVLTSHSGLVNAALFTPLPKARTGDTFTVTVLGETHTYKVDSIETVEPFITDSLAVTAGEDRVTLITCTPIGINSHRLLVHGTRIATQESDHADATHTAKVGAGVPWWLAGFLSGSGVIAYLLFRLPRTSQRTLSEGVSGVEPQPSSTNSSLARTHHTDEERPA